MASWNAIKSQIQIFLSGEPALNLPSTEDLDRFESSTGFLLPLDYRDFVLSFGLGSFEPGTWYFAVPGFHDEAPNYDPTGLTEFLRTGSGFDERSDEDLAKEFDDPQRARRLLLFCTTATNDFFGWDPEDVTDADTREYGIYMLGRYDTRVTRLATTFREFVLNYCFEGAMKPDGSGYQKVPEGREPDDYPIQFGVTPRG